MSIFFVMGPARSGKTSVIREEIAARSRQKPEQRILYIVPEQMTLSAQQALLEVHPDHGVLNTEILSFNRLAHRIFEETGMVSRKILDDMGKSMILYKIVCDHREELQYYRDSARQRGFVGQLKIMMTELYQYRIGAKELQRIIDSQEPESILFAKWKDIQVIYQYFEEYVTRETLSSEQLLDVLAERICQSRLIAESWIYLDDFSGFTPQQYRVLEGLIRRARGVTLCLSMTPAAWKLACSVNDRKEIPMNLFRETQKTAVKLIDMAKQARIPYQIQWCPAPAGSPLETLRSGLFIPGTDRWGEPQDKVFVQIMDNPAQEADRLMHEILHLVRKEGYRFRDIAVVTGNMDGYDHGLRRRMDMYRMPYYIDRKIDIILNPYAQLIIQILKTVWNGCTYESVFSFLKTGLTPLDRRQVDELENEALKENWRGASRYIRELGQREDWPEAQILAPALESFWKESGGDQRTVHERLAALRTLVEAMDVSERMKQKSRELQSRDKLSEAMEYERLPEMMEVIWEKMDETMGRIPMSSREFSNVLDLGLEQCRMGMLPPSLDQMVVGDLERTRLNGVKALFIIGFQDGSFPKTDRAPGLLNRKERELSSAILEMAPAQREDRMLQYLQLYTLLGKASERVYISSCAGNAEGQIQSPTLLWKRIMGLMETKPWPDRSGELTLPRAYLTEKGLNMSERARKWYCRNGYYSTIQNLKKARKEAVPQETLSRETVRLLMDPENRRCSVSQIEQYARCPFSYFMRYGLRLKEREKPQIRNLDDGNVLHEILEEAGEWFARLWNGQRELSEKEIQNYAAQLYEYKKEEYSVYQTTGRYRYYWKKLQNTAGYAIEILNQQLAAGEFRPEAFEWTFGRGSSKPIEIPLEEGGSVKLQGKIDRIDILRQEDGTYLRIIDYKSGRTAYKEEEIYAGLQLQLPIYMEAAMESKELSGTGPCKPAGIFYFHLIPRYQTEEKAMSPEEKKKNRLKEARLEGLLLEDRVIAEKMDKNLLTEPKVLRARITKEGKFYSKDRTATAEQFVRLGEFARGKAAEAAGRIRSGQVEAKPVRSDTKTACDFCEFKGTCRYDENLPGAKAKEIEAMDTEEFWRRIETGSKEERE